MKSLIYNLMEKFNIPKELIENKSRKIIHLTDTPSQLYPELDRLFKILSPEIVIHTGDISDEIKLERSPSKIDLHQKKLMKLNNILKKYPNTRFIFALGNHDDLNSIKSILTTAEILPTGGVVETFWGTFGVAHMYDHLPNVQNAFYLYGHSDDRLHLHTNQPRYLNGLMHIYVFTESPHEIRTIEYPTSVDAVRQRKFKIGF